MEILFFTESYTFVSRILAGQFALFTLDLIHHFSVLFSHVFVVPCISLLKDRESNLEEEFPTLEANNNTDEVEEPTENTGEMNNKK